VSQILYFPNLLGTKDSIEAMTSFLKNSKAFIKNSQFSLSLFISYITDKPLTNFIKTKS